MTEVELDGNGRAGVGNAVIARTKRLLERLGKRRRIRHAVVGACDLDGDWEWSGAVGVADRGDRPMRSDTPWFVASVTKLHTATVVLRLHEQGKMDLNAPVTDALPPELSSRLHVIDDVDSTDRITPIHLLGHLSGLPDYLDERPRGGRSLIEEILEEGDRAWSPAEAVLRARDRLTPHFPPSDLGSARPRIRYSDTNYQLLVALAEHLTHRPMSRLYRELIFQPAGLDATWLPGDPPPPSAAEPATVWLGDTPFEGRPLAMRSFGDLYSTVGDLLEYGRGLFGGGLFDASATGEMMWSRFRRFGFPRGVAALRAPSWPIEYGLGMMRFELSRFLAGGMRIPAVIGHTGSTGSWLWYVPVLRVLVAGTVDQTSGATVPFRQVPRALAGLADRGAARG